MTAEVAILNREAVAMAADSAATMQDEKGQKIFSSANKIFALSKYKPVGVMVYGNAFLMNVPWESIIKIYRQELGSNFFDTLEEYADNFFEFLIHNTEMFFSEQEQKDYVTGCIYSYFDTIKYEINNKIKTYIDENDKITEKQVKEILSVVVTKHHDAWKNANYISGCREDAFNSIKGKYEDLIDELKDEVFEKLPLSKKQSKNLTDIAVFLFIKNMMKSGTSGVVIAGFGEKEIFPSIKCYYVEGVANNILKYDVDQTKKIDSENTASVIPFAQKDMVQTFMEGINPGYNQIISDMLRETIRSFPDIIIDSIESLDNNEKEELKNKVKETGEVQLQEKLEKLDNFRENQYVFPVLTVVNHLPKNELAKMAEDLVNLTCLKKRISMEDETVGGPIDSAVISKGDGLIWINRKHYFDPSLNHQFFSNYYNNTNFTNQK